MHQFLRTCVRNVFVCLAILMLVIGGSALAQTSTSVVNGLKWLSAQVQPDGSLASEGKSIATPLQARSEAAQTLQLLATSPGVLNSLIVSDQDANTEYLARKIIALSAVQADTSSLVSVLVSRVNPDGGYAGAPGYVSSGLDTSLALLALKKAGHTESVANAIAYLQSIQQADGSFQLNGRTDTYTSIYALAAYRAHASAYAISLPIQSSVNYLMAQQSAPGTWNNSVFLSALAYENLHDFIPAAPTANALQNYILSTQMPDGSWGGDPYQTALALRALSIGQSIPRDPSLATLTGRLVESQTGLPIAGVRVALTGGATALLTTGDDGSFTFNNLTPGNFTVSFSLNNYASISSILSLKPGQVLDLGTVKMVKVTGATTATIYGVITSAASNAPLAGVTVSAAGLIAVTDAKGAYQFANVVPGDITISASKTGYQTINSLVHVNAGAILIYSPGMYLTTDIPNVTSSTVSGQVMDAGSNQALAGVKIVVTDTAGPHALQSDASGKFSIGNLLKDTRGLVSISFQQDKYLDVVSLVSISGLATVDVGQIRMRKATATSLLPHLVITHTDRKNAVTNPQSLVLSGALEVTLQNQGSADVPAGVKVLAFDDVNKNKVFDSATDKTLGTLILPNSVAVGQTIIVQVPVNGVLAFRDAPITVWADSDQVLLQSSLDNTLRSSADFSEFKPNSALFQPKLKWAWSGGNTMPDYNQVETTPLVMPAGKGSKSSNIIFGSYRGRGYRDGILRIVNGADGSEVLTVTDPAYRISPLSNLAAADLDGSGDITIIAQKADNGLIAFSSSGAVKWMVPASQFVSGWHGGGVSIADLDGDGKAEIIYGNTVFNYDGTLRWQGSGSYLGDNYQRFYGDIVAPYSIVADINLTGHPAVIAGASAYNSNGNLLWQNQAVGDGFTAIANFNGSAYPQIVVVHKGFVSLLDHTGAVIWGPVYLPRGVNGGVPVVADIDGDGIPEIGIAGQYAYTVLRADGSIKWSVSTYDISAATGSSVFDFSGDGKAKIVYSDQFNLKVYDGASGNVVFNIPNISDTSYEMAVVADVDNDGHADIIIPQSAGATEGLRVYQDVNNQWVGTRKIWNQHSYHITNINDDGTVPRVEKNSWEITNNYRLNARVGISATAVPDVSASFIRIQPTSDVTASKITVRIGNAGLLPISSGLNVAFYSGQAGAGGVLLGKAVTTIDLNSDDYQDVSLSYTGSIANIKTLVIVADDDGAGVHTLSDFDVTNNAVSIDPSLLPAAFSLTTTLDQASYAANSTMQISTVVGNLGSFDNNAQVQWNIQTPGGVTVASLPAQTIKVAAGATGSVNAVWNTGNILAGSYQLVAQVIDTNGQPYTQPYSQTVTPFAISSGNTVLTAKASTDKTSYSGADTVQLSDTISNTTQNLPVDNIQVQITVSNPDGTTRFTKTDTLAQLPSANSKNYNYSLPLAGAPAGQYSVKVSAIAGSTTAQATTSFIVTASSSNGNGLTGTVTVNPAKVQAGGALALNFTVNNQGNSLLANQPLSLNIIDPVNQKVLAQFPYTATLDKGASFIGNTTWVASAGAGSSTDSTYVATLTAAFGANTLTLAQANFSVTAPQYQLSAAIDSDKASYLPTDVVKLHDKISNTTPNLAAANLQIQVTVKNPDGSTRFTKTDSLASLASNAAQDYNYSLNLSAAPAGQYTTTVIVSSTGNTVLAQASGGFLVASTATTGSGLKGSISASASQVPVGNSVSFPFNVSNLGNADLPNLPLNVSITDATQKVLASYPYSTTLAMTAQFNGSTDWVTTGTAGSQYNAVLSAKVGNNTLNLGQVSFSLTAPVVSLSLKQTAAPWQNVLVYSACKRAADDLLGKCAATKFPVESVTTLAQCDTGRASQLDQTLAGLGISHTVSTDVTSFLSNLRSGNYNTYWISNGASSLQEPAASELLAAIKRGDGFMLDSLVTATNTQLAQCSGVTNNGAYTTALQQLSLTGGIFTRADLTGPATQTKLSNSGGTVEATLNGAGLTSPGIVSTAFGNGKTLAYGFDWKDTLSAQPTETRWPAILKTGLSYLTPAAANLNALLPGDVSTLTSTITNGGASQPLHIVQSLPAGAVVQSTTPTAVIGNIGNAVTVTWDVTATSAADTIVTVRWKAPMTAGSYTANLAVSMVNGTTVTPYKSQDQAITIQSASQLTAQTISLVQGLNLSGAAPLAQRTAILDLLNQASTALSSNTTDKALRLLVTVQAKLKNIETGVGPVNKSLASLMAVVERQSAH